MVHTRHPHAGHGSPREAQKVAPRNGIAQLLGQHRHLIRSDRLLHLPPQLRIARQPLKKLLERIQRPSMQSRQTLQAAVSLNPFSLAQH